MRAGAPLQPRELMGIGRGVLDGSTVTAPAQQPLIGQSLLHRGVVMSGVLEGRSNLVAFRARRGSMGRGARAMLLAASGQDIGSTPESRRRFVARAATNEWMRS